MADSPNACGTCVACCKIFAIPELEKKAGVWCSSCAIGKGCKIYDKRPEVCRSFECLWLLSQSKPGSQLPPELRPDRCKVVFSATTNDDIIGATTMPGAPDAWQRKPVANLIDSLVQQGVKVTVGTPASTTRLVISRHGVREVRMTPPDKDGMQYNIPDD